MDKFNAFEKGILENTIYDNKELNQFILELEKKYCVIDEIMFFNNLVNFSKNVQIPYHKWFKYREGYSHTLIKELLKRCNISKDEYVLDPFCGSGTTIVEGVINGFSGLGIDINPMSAYVSKIKARYYSDKEKNEIKTAIELLNFKKYRYEYIQTNDGIEEVRKYFSENNFNQLMVIRKAISNFKNDKKIYDVLFVGYLCIIEDVSDRKRDGNGLKSDKSKVENVYDFYKLKLSSIIDDIFSDKIDENIKVNVVSGSAMDLDKYVEKFSKVSGLSLGSIMYSPPYANSFDYFESYKLEIILGEFVDNMKEINDYRDKAVKSFVRKKEEKISEFKFVNDIAEEIENAIPIKEAKTGKRDSRTRKVPQMIKGYFEDMAQVIMKSSKVLESGKRCYIVVDQSSYLGKIVPTDLFLARIGELYGFKVNEIIVCRNAKTSGQQLSAYPYLKTMLRESIVVLEKI